MKISVAWPVLVCFWTAAAAGAQRQIELEPPNLYNPVVITEASVGGVQVQAGAPRSTRGLRDPILPFEAGDDWLEQVDLHLFNRTNKVIVAGRIVVWLPETKVGNGITWVIHLDFGVMPANDHLSNGRPFPHLASQIPASWQPGQPMVLHLADYADVIKRNLSDGMQARAPSRIFISKSAFFFSDGMRWMGNVYATPDPQRPGKFIFLKRGYFPGNEENNWPVPGQRLR